jgi:phytoene/squalene synthetase
VIEEIESLGRSQLQAVESLLENAFIHILKIFADPASLSQRQWRVETAGFLKGARKRFRPSMARAIDLAEIWREAIDSAERELKAYDRVPPANIPLVCPFGLEDILDQAFDDNRAVQALSQAAARDKAPR